MADLSDTRGTLIIKIDRSLEETQKIVEEMSEVSLGWGDYITELMHENIKEINPNTYSVPFWGSGRYSFYSNVEWFSRDKEILEIYKKYDINKLQLIFVYDDLLECMGEALINTMNFAEIYRAYSPTGKVVYLSRIQASENDLTIDGYSNNDMWKYYYPFVEDEEEIEVIVTNESGSES